MSEAEADKIILGLSRHGCVSKACEDAGVERAEFYMRHQADEAFQQRTDRAMGLLAMNRDNGN